MKQGLIGPFKFSGKQGVMDYIRQAGCVQFDPVDVCGKNAELVLQSRVKGFKKDMLDELLYKDRVLFDYLDKQLAIIPIADWPYFERFREAAREGGRQFEELAPLEKRALAYIEANGEVSSAELPLEGNVNWHSSIHWSGGEKQNAARAVLEQLYSTGRLVIHHKKGTRKYYDLAERHIPAEILTAPEPLPDEFEHQKWRVLRRIGAVGLIWNRPSFAWLRIRGLNQKNRNEIFKELCENGEIIPVDVEGIKHKFYCRAEDMHIIEAVLRGPAPKPRMELIAPLDCLLWDRDMVRALFGFSYLWEIYTPAEKREFGAYNLPLLYGDSFIGQVEAVNERSAKTLNVKNIWLKDGARQTKKRQSALENCLKRFAKFNDCELTTVLC